MLNFPFTALQILIPMPDTGFIYNYTALLGDRDDVRCPMQPDALQQHYLVIWMKEGVEIANSQSTRKSSSRYDIDRTTYALIIDPMSVNDTSSSYQCQLFVINPITDTKQRLQYYPQLHMASGMVLFTALQTLIPTPDSEFDVMQNDISSSGEKVVLPCPINLGLYSNPYRQSTMLR